MIESVTGQAGHEAFAVQFGMPIAPGAEAELKSNIDELYEGLVRSPEPSLLARMPAVIICEGKGEEPPEVIFEFVAVPGHSSFEAVGRAGVIVDALLQMVSCQTPPAMRVGVIAMELWVSL